VHAAVAFYSSYGIFDRYSSRWAVVPIGRGYIPGIPPWLGSFVQFPNLVRFLDGICPSIDLDVKVFVVPFGREFWGMQEHGSQIYAHSITRGGPDGRLAGFLQVLFPICRQCANSPHGPDIRILTFVAFLAWHTGSCSSDQVISNEN
jgi:hypothetical protein